MPHPLIVRAQAAAGAGFAATSSFVGDLAHADLTHLRRELPALGVALSTIDPYLAWYPGFDPRNPIGVGRNPAFKGCRGFPA